jgi:hypothetical protein
MGAPWLVGSRKVKGRGIFYLHQIEGERLYKSIEFCNFLFVVLRFCTELDQLL